MTRSIAYKYCVYLLLAFLPLQALAVSRMAVCVDTTSSIQNSNAQRAATTMDHCAHMATMSPSSPDNSPSHSHKQAHCWLGSVCLAQVAAHAVPVKLAPAAIEHSAPNYPSVVTHYRSVVLNNLQRPPTFLQA